MSNRLSRDTYELPLINEGETRPQSPNPDKRGRLYRWYTGWRFTLFLAAAACIIVLSFNLGFLLWAVAKHHVEGDRGTLYEGDCDRVKQLSTGLHLLINILSTTLLAASNYTMQCLCAPTRKDIDKAHEQGNWLDIGVPSVRNLFHLSKRRSIMWICLALSSTPLHLMYNSTIFSATGAYPYGVFAGHYSLETKNIDDLVVSQQSAAEAAAFERLYQAAKDKTLEIMDNVKCINAYATTYQSKHGDLLLITEDVNTTNHYDSIGIQEVYDPFISASPYSWICPSNRYNCPSLIPDIKSRAESNNWTVVVDQKWLPVPEPAHSRRVDFCLSVKLRETCKLQYSLPLTISVIVVNAFKLTIICCIIISMAEWPILTTGDAIASFLRQPDKYTLGQCLVPRWGLKKAPHRLGDSTTDGMSRPNYDSRPYSEKQRRKAYAVSGRVWVMLFLSWITSIGFCAILLMYANSKDGKEIWDAAFGSISPQALIKADKWPSSLIGNTIIANIPQLVFSLLYFAFNSVLTSMALATEWSRYALSRKGVRVSWNPQSAQRSDYFLSLPYRYAIPLMTCSAILHWLISQSLFLVGVEAYTDINQEWVRDPESDLNMCGYNPVAIVIAIVIGVVMFACLIWICTRRLPSAMVVAGSCSLVIAAACHPKYDPNLHEDGQKLQPEEEMEFLPVKWGSVPVSGDIGHCTFTSDELDMPEPGKMYR